ncbi:hypothetical protein [Lacipirellula sp.]|uniref:hypothetical protein n=1 Tax=Lacipirellula sp. TaxID=2691419 RepID=UPI003D0B21B2
MRQLEHCAIFVILAIAAAGTFRCEAGEPAATHDPREAELQQILASWTERSTSIWALDATQSLSQTVRGRGDRPLPPDADDPFADDPAPKDDATIRTQSELLLCKDRAATTTVTNIQSPRDPDRWMPLTLRFSINGDEHRTLQQEKSHSLGYVEFAPNRHGAVFNYQPCLPIFLWLHPQEVIRKSQWLDDEMYVEELDVVADDVKCRRIVIPHKHEQWISTIDVDPERGYIPLRWETRLRSKNMSCLTIEYRKDAIVGFAPSGWVEKFDGSEPTHAEVSINSINQEITADRLSVAFPPGTFVTRSKGQVRVYGIQREGGLEKLDRKQFMKEVMKAQQTIQKEI